MILSPFDYVAASTVEEAVQVLSQAGEDAKVLAGDQSLVPVLRLAAPTVIVDLSKISELRRVRNDGDAIVVGAMTTHHDVINDLLVGEHAALLAAATKTVGDPQIRHRGTVGGALVHADPAGDLLAPAVALDSENGHGGHRPDHHGQAGPVRPRLDGRRRRQDHGSGRRLPGQEPGTGRAARVSAPAGSYPGIARSARNVGIVDAPREARTACAARAAQSSQTPIRPARVPVADEIDLLGAAGPAVAKRAIPAIAALALLLALAIIRRRRRASPPLSRVLGADSNSGPDFRVLDPERGNQG